MQRIKAFSTQMAGSDLAQFEQLVNDWLENDQPQLVQMTQSAFADNLALIFLYETGQGEQEERMIAHAAVPKIFETGLRDADLDPLDEPEFPDAELPY
jgi:hypothetical protein